MPWGWQGRPITGRVPFTLFPPDLSKHRRYEIRMSVYNAVGEGPPSPPQEVFVGEAGESWRGCRKGARLSWNPTWPRQGSASPGSVR